MADKKLTYTVQAKDDASAVMQKIGSSAKREMGKVADSFDEGGSAGKQFARVLDQMADDLDDNLTRSQRAADKLGEALGPDLRAKIGENGIDQFVGDMRRAGLSFDDIEADADELAASIKKLDDVASRAGDSTAAGFKRVGDAAEETGHRVDNTRSVVANFAGNAAQEMPGVAGAFGPLNMAISQFTEYATEGDIKFKNFIAAAGPIAGIAFVVSKVSGEFARNAQFVQRAKDEVNDLAKSLNEGDTAAEALTKRFRDMGKVEVDLPFQNTQDLTGRMADLGVTVEQFSELAAGSTDQLATWAQAMRDAGVDGDALNAVLVGIGVEHVRLADAQRTAAVTASVLGKAEDDSADAMDRVRRASGDAAAALRDQREATDELMGTHLDLADAMVDVSDQIRTYIETMGDAEASDNDKLRAGSDLLRSYNSLGEAAKADAEAQARAAGRSSTAVAEGAQAQITALLGVAGNMAPGSPLRTQLEGYIIELAQTQQTRVANIVANTSQAVQQVQALQRLLAGVAENSYEVDVHARNTGARASGGPVAAGQSYVVGERGPELLTMGASSGYVTPNSALTAAAPMGAGAQSVVIQVTLDGRVVGEAVYDTHQKMARQGFRNPWS